MNVYFQALLPELILVGTACVLFLLGVVARASARRLAAGLALAALLAVFGLQLATPLTQTLADSQGAVRVFAFAQYIKLLAAGVGAVLVLLAWPGNKNATGNRRWTLAMTGRSFMP